MKKKPQRKRVQATGAKTGKQAVVLMNSIVPMAKAAIVWAELPLRFRRDYLAGFSRGLSPDARRTFRRFLRDMSEALE